MITETNVLIIGAGPAGASASLFLTKEKIPHTIIEKNVFPRDKVCGDALSNKVTEVLGSLDIDLVDEMMKRHHEFVQCWGVKFAAPNGKFVDIPYKEDIAGLRTPPGYISKRFHFDNFLFEKLNSACADIHVGMEVKEVIKKNGFMKVVGVKDGEEKVFHAKVVVGAEGDRSIVAKKFAGKEFDPKHYVGAVRAYYKNVTGFHELNFIELHFLKELIPGYMWIFPLPNGEANVGVGMLSSKIRSRKMDLRKAMLHAIEHNPTIRHRFANAEPTGEIRGWTLPLGSKKRRLSGDHFLLTGDAASLVDPLTGEGIGNALKSGMIAAKHIQQALKNNCFDAQLLAAYDREVYSLLWPELKLSYRMQRMGVAQWFLNIVIGKAAKSKMLRETLSCMFEDLDVRARLGNPMFYLKLLLNRKEKLVIAPQRAANG